jgi:hypothetical protein
MNLRRWVLLGDLALISLMSIVILGLLVLAGWLLK